MGLDAQPLEDDAGDGGRKQEAKREIAADCPGATGASPVNRSPVSYTLCAPTAVGNLNVNGLLGFGYQGQMILRKKWRKINF